jgi:hypothetical protein
MVRGNYAPGQHYGRQEHKHSCLTDLAARLLRVLRIPSFCRIASGAIFSDSRQRGGDDRGNQTKCV